MKAFLCKLICSKAGGFIQAGAGAVTGFIFSLGAKYLHVAPTPELETQLTGGLVFLGMLLVNGGVQYWQTGNFSALEKSLGLMPAGFVHPELIRRATEATPEEVKAFVAQAKAAA